MTKRILIIGSGGREHAIGQSLSQSPQSPQLYFAPGNPGTAKLGQNVEIQAQDILALITFCKTNDIDFSIVGPEDPLVAGLVDQFEAQGLKAIGPKSDGAQLEGSKHWAKEFMTKYQIPTAASATFSDYDTAIQYLDSTNTYPIVIKADGLAAGKGVTVAQSESEAKDAVKDCLVDDRFSGAGSQIVIEEFMPGEEASVLAFVDGHTIVPMVAAQDHKPAFDQDKGPNTGGMGAYSPAPIVTPQLESDIYTTVLRPALEGLQSEGIHYCGILYAGLMIHNGVAKVVEFNVRFGDPETQVVLPRLSSDLVDVFESMLAGTLAPDQVQWSSDSTVCVVIAANGYPGAYKKGIPITLPEANDKTAIIHAGTKQSGPSLLSNGGRVLGVVASDSDLKHAINTAYATVESIEMDGKHYRHDIGQKALINRG